MRLLEQLSEWRPTEIAQNSEYPLCACIEELWVMLYENGYIEIGDIVLTHAWLKSLIYAGYKFPSLSTSHVTILNKNIMKKPSIIAPIGRNNSNAEVANMTIIVKNLPTLKHLSNISAEKINCLSNGTEKKITRRQIKKKLRL